MSDEKSSLPRTPIALIVQLSKPYVFLAISALLASSIATLLGSILVPYLSKILVDHLTHGASNASEILRLGITIPIAWYVTFCAWRVSGFTGARWSRGVQADVSRRLFAHLMHHDAAYFESRFAGALVGKIGNAESVSSLINGFTWGLITLPIMLIASFIVMYAENAMLGFIMLVWVAIALPASFLLTRKRRALAKLRAETNSALRGMMVDVASHISAVRQTAREEEEMTHVDAGIERFRIVGLRSWLAMEWARVAIDAMVLAFLLASVGGSAYLWSTGEISAGTVVMVLAFAQQIQRHVRDFGDKFGELLDTYGTVEEGLGEILKPHGMIDAPGAKSLEISAGEIMVDHAFFTYETTHKTDEKQTKNGDENETKSTIIPSTSSPVVSSEQSESRDLKTYADFSTRPQSGLGRNDEGKTSGMRKEVSDVSREVSEQNGDENGAKTSHVFADLNLRICGGERVGIVGASGAGKSTLVSLILRERNLTSGSIKIDGQNITEITAKSLRENVALVSQDPALFHRTIRENIAYGKPSASDEEIRAAAKFARADEFIERLPKTYETLVGERGVQLSGGQRQRVAIARAMLRDARILILDEATSALDSESEAAVQSALGELMKGRTVLAIAHRLSTLRAMDRIIVLDAGKIAEDGMHDELLARGGIYARLWARQAGGFLPEDAPSE